MVSPARRKTAVVHAAAALSVSQRRACKTLGQARSTQRYRPRPKDEERIIVARMGQLVRAHPRYGYRRIAALLRAEGRKANNKRIHRLWRKEGFRVPKRTVRRRARGTSANGCALRRATRPNEVLAWDFVHDRTASGRALKWLTLIDEYTRECLLLEPRRSIRAGDARALLESVVRRRGAPAFLRSDNGPEFVARELRSWLATERIATLYIEPGSPWENGFAESFHARLRDELINVELFGSRLEAETMARQWKEDYNNNRPHSSLGYLTPARFALDCGNRTGTPGPESLESGFVAGGPQAPGNAAAPTADPLIPTGS